MERVYCIKDFVGEKDYQKFHLNNAYNIKSISNEIVVVCFKEDSRWSNCVVFRTRKTKKFIDFQIFEDFFMKEKEYRKLKLKKIYENK